MSRIVLVEDIFGLVPVTGAEKGCEYPSIPSFLTPQSLSFGVFLSLQSTCLCPPGYEWQNCGIDTVWL